MKQILCAFLCAALLLAPISGTTPHVYAAANKTVYLTFDDGPTDSTTPHILDVLKAEHVHATFFVIGRQIHRREPILQRTFQEGHTIGIHTFSHEYAAIYASPSALLSDIRKCEKAIQTVLPNWSSKLYRFPGGSANLSESLVSAVKNAGFTICEWNASVDDAISPAASAKDLYANAVRSASGKNTVVLLLHDGVGYRETVESLPNIISYFRENGYAFHTL